MLGLGNTGAVGALATASKARRQVLYQDHAGALYEQALLMLGNSALARLAQSVFRRCQQLTADPGRQDRCRPQQPSLGVAGCVDPGGISSEKERGALGLVLFDGLGYVQASTVLGIGPHDMAALLRTVMGGLAISSAAAAGTSKSVKACGRQAVTGRRPGAARSGATGHRSNGSSSRTR